MLFDILQHSTVRYLSRRCVRGFTDLAFSGYFLAYPRDLFLHRYLLAGASYPMVMGTWQPLVDNGNISILSEGARTADTGERRE